MNQNEFPRMVYQAGGNEEIHGGRFATNIVNDQDELDAALASGWHRTTTEAAEAPERERLAREEASARAEEDRARAAQAEADAQAAREAAAREQAEQAERDRIAAEERAAAEAAAAAAATARKNADSAPPTRAELEAKATELGIEFSPNIGDKKLGERIAAALAKG